ncbi:HNH endonuclease [Rhodococcus rhodochrous]|uniref:HNH endonuclease n=1 Tax=Rhodococcus rhodochrous TaxID=1829 RepID=UPI001E39EF14|nr:HNH endonuclease [Rhodococcus rhodochrous]MCB8912058.1 HNH endonuclease [Rhodococcus rhodochrous]
MTKTCRRCNKVKNLDESGPDRRTRDGRRSYCKRCQSEDRRKRYHANPERELPRQREYRVENRDRIRQYDAERAERRSELQWASLARGRMRRYGITGRRVEDITRADIIARYGDRCIYCDSGPFEEIDHTRAIRAGGEHVLDNVVPTCRECNAWKLQTVDKELIRAFDAGRAAGRPA